MVEWNLGKARKSWGKVAAVLGKRKVNAQKMAYFYQAIVQAVLLYGSETWVMTQPIIQKLNTFHHQCARFITGSFIHPNDDGTWTYPNSKIILKKAGLATVEEYIKKGGIQYSHHTWEQEKFIKNAEKARTSLSASAEKVGGNKLMRMTNDQTPRRSVKRVARENL